MHVDIPDRPSPADMKVAALGLDSGFPGLLTAGTRRLCSGPGSLLPADSQLQHHRDEAKKHRHHKDTHYSGSHRRQLPRELLARGGSLAFAQLGYSWPFSGLLSPGLFHFSEIKPNFTS